MPNDLTQGPFDHAERAPESPLEHLTSGFSPAPLPPMGPDGGPVFTPAPTDELAMQPISRCALGPCRHLHTMTTKIESQDPIDGSSGIINTIVTSTCYPAPGAEVDISGHPVFECSKWSPLSTSDLFVIDRQRTEFTHGHKAELATFEDSWANRSKGAE